MKIKNLLTGLTVVSIVLMWGCKKEDTPVVINHDTTKPTVTSTVSANSAVNVGLILYQQQTSVRRSIR